MWVIIRAVSLLALLRFREKPLGTLRLIATLSTAIVTWLVLSAIASPFLASKAGAALNSELSIANARLQTNAFPLRHIRKLESLPSIASASYFGIASFPCPAAAGTLSVNAYGGSGVTPWLRAEGAHQAQLDSWNATPNGLLVGAEAAQRCGLFAGMQFTPREYLSQREVPLQVVAVLPPGRSGMADRLAYGHYDYFNRVRGDAFADLVLRARIKGTDPSRLDQLAEQIETAFLAEDPPLLATPTSGTESALGRFGQVQSLLWLIMLAIAACTALVFIAVLAHSTILRRPSMAMLQTLGFGRRLQYTAQLLEFGMIALVATGAGICISIFVLATLNPHVSWVLGQLSIQAWALQCLPVGIFLLCVLAMAIPLLQVRTLRPIDHLPR